MNRGNLIRVWLPLLLGSWTLGLVFAVGPGPRGFLRWIGLGLAISGLSGVVLARHTLGGSFSILPKAKELVTRGIYSRIRNPIYISAEVSILGMCLICRQTYLWLFFILVIPLQVFRARRESRALEAKFGDAYREYRARTWF